MEKNSYSDSFMLYPLDGVERGRLLLEIPTTMLEIPDHVAEFAEKNDFIPKAEYHLTVIGKKTQTALAENGRLDDAMALVGAVPHWKIGSLGNFYVLNNREADDQGHDILEESIIQLLDLPVMDELYDKIRQATHMDIETPPAHVTLYTKNADRGIGVYSQAQLAEYITLTLA